MESTHPPPPAPRRSAAFDHEPEFRPMSPKNRRICDLPQHMPATRLATEKNRLTHLMSPSILLARRPRSEPRASASGTRKSGYPIPINANRRRNQYRRLCIYPGPFSPLFHLGFFDRRPRFRTPPGPRQRSPGWRESPEQGPPARTAKSPSPPRDRRSSNESRRPARTPKGMT